jgi:hypothetical protein
MTGRIDARCEVSDGTAAIELRLGAYCSYCLGDEE